MSGSGNLILPLGTGEGVADGAGDMVAAPVVAGEGEDVGEAAGEGVAGDVGEGVGDELSVASVLGSPLGVGCGHSLTKP